MPEDIFCDIRRVRRSLMKTYEYVSFPHCLIRGRGRFEWRRNVFDYTYVDSFYALLENYDFVDGDVLVKFYENDSLMVSSIMNVNNYQCIFLERKFVEQPKRFFVEIISEYEATRFQMYLGYSSVKLPKDYRLRLQ